MTWNRGDRLDRIEAVLEQTATRLNQVAHQQAANTEAIGQLTQRVDGLTVEIHSLNATLMQSIENAETDRASFQAEIRRIWEYLLAQSGNGHTSG